MYWTCSKDQPVRNDGGGVGIEKATAPLSSAKNFLCSVFCSPLKDEKVCRWSMRGF